MEWRGARREGKTEERRCWEHSLPGREELPSLRAQLSSAWGCGLPPARHNVASPRELQRTMVPHALPLLPSLFWGQTHPKDCCISLSRLRPRSLLDPASPVLLSPRKPCIRGGATSLSRPPQRPQQSLIPLEIHQTFPPLQAQPGSPPGALI